MKTYLHKYDKAKYSFNVYKYATLIRFYKWGLGFAYMMLISSCATYHPHAGDLVKMRTLHKSRIFTAIDSTTVTDGVKVYSGVRGLRRVER